MKIYFAGSIRGGRFDSKIYFEIIKYLKNYGEVLTEHVGLPNISSDGEKKFTDEFIHNRDMEWLMTSDVIVAEVSNPSLGVGYELGRAVENKKKILCLYRSQEGKKLSAMIEGCGSLVVKKYSSLADAKRIISDFLKI